MRISVLGMGRMGQALAGRLLDSGHDVVLWNRTPGRADELVGRGAHEADRIVEAVADVDVAVTSLANDDAVREVACGEDGIWGALGKDSVYVDASTVSPSLTGQLAEAFPRFVAMPVLGSPVAVAGGQAVFLVGGQGAAVHAVDSLFPGLSDKVLHYDSPSLASAGKLTVNLLLLDGVVALAESFAVGRAGGLSDGQLRELLGDSPMVAPGIRNRFEGVLTGDQDPWWSAALGAKDAGLAIDLVRGAGGDLPSTRTVRERYEKVAAEAEDADVAGVGRLYID